MAIIQTFAPTSEHDDEEVEEFYKLLEFTLRKVPQKNITIIQGVLECQSRTGCVHKLGRNSRKIWHWGDKQQRSQTDQICQKSSFNSGQYTTPPINCPKLQTGSHLMRRSITRWILFWFHNIINPLTKET